MLGAALRVLLGHLSAPAWQRRRPPPASRRRAPAGSSPMHQPPYGAHSFTVVQHPWAAMAAVAITPRLHGTFSLAIGNGRWGEPLASASAWGSAGRSALCVLDDATGCSTKGSLIDSTRVVPCLTLLAQRALTRRGLPCCPAGVTCTPLRARCAGQSGRLPATAAAARQTRCSACCAAAGQSSSSGADATPAEPALPVAQAAVAAGTASGQPAWQTAAWAVPAAALPMPAWLLPAAMFVAWCFMTWWLADMRNSPSFKVCGRQMGALHILALICRTCLIGRLTALRQRGELRTNPLGAASGFVTEGAPASACGVCCWHPLSLSCGSRSCPFAP